MVFLFFMKSFLTNTYFTIYKFIADKRIKQHDLPERFIHAHLVCVAATGFLMWAYALLAYYTIDHPIPWIVGAVASLVHLFSPLLYRVNNNHYFNTNIFLAAGIAHQATFAFYCGGFYSNIIIWFGILPMLAGVVCGRRGVVTWVIACTLVSAGFLYLQATGFVFPNLITPTGLLLSQALVTFGWIYASAIIIWVFLLLVEIHQKEIEDKKEGIQNLIYVITHDISNPLTVVIGRSMMLKKAELPENLHGSIAKISSAATSITEIVNNVKNLFASELGKTRIELAEVNLVSVLNTLKENFCDKLDAKNLDLQLQYKENETYIIQSNTDLLVHQILGNLLSNAIKFTPESSFIWIILEKNKEGISILIKDTGIGIPKDLVDKLFDIHAKTNRRGTSGESGTGFGLPIVKTYLEKLDGKISVQSVTGEENRDRGTTFTIDFQ